jgi:hypothetical protein
VNEHISLSSLALVVVAVVVVVALFHGWGALMPA